MIRLVSKILLCIMSSILVAIPININAFATSNDISEKTYDVRKTSLISPGICVIASSEKMAVTAKKGNDAVFEVKDFELSTGNSVIDYLTVTKLPEQKDGKLAIGSIAISQGQSITRLNLSRLAFVPTDDSIEKASFCFSVNGAAHEYTCEINYLKQVNTAPSLDSITSAGLNTNTFCDMCTVGRMSAYDAEGDELFFTLTDFPRHGSIVITDRALGSYIYKPESGFSGKDTFSYAVRDKWGDSTGESVTVHISVKRRSNDKSFTDMENDIYESIALTVSDAGLMSGTIVGGDNYFYPSGTVSRGDFLVMAMKAANIKELPDAEKTIFSDDEDIPDNIKNYVSAAYKMGVCSGWIKDGKQCFCAEEAITAAEAATITAKLLELKSPSKEHINYLDLTIPVWASDSYNAMKSAGFLDASLDMSARKKLDRISCAGILCAILRYKD